MWSVLPLAPDPGLWQWPCKLGVTRSIFTVSSWPFSVRHPARQGMYLNGWTPLSPAARKRSVKSSASSSPGKHGNKWSKLYWFHRLRCGGIYIAHTVIAMPYYYFFGFGSERHEVSYLQNKIYASALQPLLDTAEASPASMKVLACGDAVMRYVKDYCEQHLLNHKVEKERLLHQVSFMVRDR